MDWTDTWTLAEPSRTPDDGAVGPPAPAARARRSTVMSKVWVGFVCLLVLLFAGFALNASVALVRAPQPLAKAIGGGVILVVLVTVAVLAREVWFGRQTERLADQLEAEGGLPEDDLPRSPGGRIDREAADAQFDLYRVEAEAAPRDWRARYRLALAYDASGDRRRAREAAREAVRLHRAG